MNDRELLELAAKAAGVSSHWGDGWQSDMMFRSIPRHNSPLVTNVEWDPLNDDGDALRLAVTLTLNVDLAYGEECVVRVFNDTHFFKESTAQDPFAATRRAIVRAAAEIGKAMP